MSGRREIKQEGREALITALREAEAGAIAAIGLRSWQARNAIKRGIRRYRDERWKQIVAMAKAGEFPRVRENDYERIDVDRTETPMPRPKRGEHDEERWRWLVEHATTTAFVRATPEELQKGTDSKEGEFPDINLRLLAALDLLSNLAAGPRRRRARVSTASTA